MLLVQGVPRDHDLVRLRRGRRPRPRRTCRGRAAAFGRERCRRRDRARRRRCPRSASGGRCRARARRSASQWNASEPAGEANGRAQAELRESLGGEVGHLDLGGTGRHDPPQAAHGGLCRHLGRVDRVEGEERLTRLDDLVLLDGDRTRGDRRRAPGSTERSTASRAFAMFDVSWATCAASILRCGPRSWSVFSSSCTRRPCVSDGPLLAVLVGLGQIRGRHEGPDALQLRLRELQRAALDLEAGLQRLPTRRPAPPAARSSASRRASPTETSSS